MKVAVPITINDSNMTSNAVDETYPTWGGGVYQTVAYWATPPERLVKVVVDEITRDMWGFSGPSTRRIYKKAAADTAFTLVATIGDAGDTIRDIAVDYSGYVYIIYSDYSAVELSVYRIHPVTYEVIGPICSVATDLEIVSLALDTFLGDIFFSAGAKIYKYTNATGVTAVHYTASETAVVSLAVDPSNKNIYAGTMAPYNILKQTASTGAFAEIASDVDYVYGVAVNWDRQELFCYSQEVGVVAEIFHLPGLETAFVSLGDAPYRIGGMSCDRGTLYFTYESRLSLGVFSNAAFSEGDYVIYGTDIYLALVDPVSAVPGTDASKWFLHSSLNRLRMFDSQLTTKTEVSGMDLIVAFTSNEIDTIGLFNVVGASVTVIVTNGWGVVESSTQAVSTRNVVFENLPSNINAVYQVIITPLNGVASCGNMVAGMSNAIGTLMRDVELSLVSYSKTTIDDFGRPSFTVRGRAKKLECTMLVEKADSNRVYELFNQNDAKLCMWVGPPGYPHLTVFGWYQRFELQLGAADTAKYNLEIQGDVDTLATETSPALAAPGALEIVEAYLSVEGNGVFLLFNRAAYVGAGGSGGFVVTIGEIAYPLTYVSGDGTNAFLFEFSGDFIYDEAAVVDYTQPGNGIEDSDGGDLVVSTPVPLDLLYGGVRPTVVSVAVAENGTTVTIVFDLPVSIGTGGSGGFTLNGATLTYVSGLPGNTAVFSVATIFPGVTVTAAYVQPGDGIEQTVSGLDLLSFSGVSVTNNSDEDVSDIVLWSGLDGVISGTTYTATAQDYPPNHTAVVQGVPVRSTGIKKVGQSSLYRPDTSPLPYVEFTIPGNTPLRIGIWHYTDVEYMNYPFWLRSSTSAITHVRPYIHFGGSFKLDGALGAYISQQTYTADLSPTIWRFIELIFDPPNKKIKVLMNGVEIIDYTHSTAFPTSNPIDRILLGDYNSTGPKDYNDNLIVSTDITRDLYALALLEASPRVL